MPAAASAQVQQQEGHLHCPQEKAKNSLTTFLSLNHPFNSPCLPLVSCYLIKFPQMTVFQGRSLVVVVGVPVTQPSASHGEGPRVCVYPHAPHIQTLAPAALYTWTETSPKAHCNLHRGLGDKQSSLNEDVIYLARVYPSRGTTGSFTLGAGTARSSRGTEGTSDDKSAQHHQP